MLTEKEEIEYHTAIGFLKLYNQRFGSDFDIINIEDAPDIKCKDSKGNILNLEITMTEDSNGCITSALGRSDKKSIEHLRKHLKRVRERKERLIINCSSANVFANLLRCIEAKLSKDYGSNVALVVRDTSGVDWDWDHEIPRVVNALSTKRNPFDKGIWIMNITKTRLFKII